MVYESDFYTTRRPYSRPTVTSYTVTGQTYHHAIPNVAHRRLTPVSAPVHSTVHVRPSVIIAAIDRINHKLRPSLAYQPAEDFLNDRSVVSFDDETRSIRAQTNALLKRIHAPLPRVSKPLPVVFSTYQAEETALPPRITSDAYIHRMLGDLRDVRRDVLTMAQYPEPAKAYIGKGHLACISYAGGRPVARRRKLFHDDDLIKNEVTLLSHYDRMRQAAKSPHVDVDGEVSYTPYTPIYASVPRKEPFNSRFYKPKFQRDPTAKRASERVVEAVEAAEAEASGETDRKKAAERAAEEREQREMAARAEAAAAEAEAARLKAERKAAADKKAHEDFEAKRKAEEEAIRQAEEARKAEEERKEAERKAEEERLEAERKAEEERLEAERRAEEERLEAERKAEEERLEAERKAEEERLEAEKAAEQTQAEEEPVAEAEAAASEVDAAAAEEPAAPEAEATEAVEAAAAEAEAEAEPAVAEAEGEAPVVEEPTSPDTPAPAPASEDPASGTAIEEVFSGDDE
ncbi:hypothetical protein R5R35_013884 [Gryllus longicercus]|uniref:Uncharacterized protein n=1 Tax=Gryllus longicercus TaxID=2509291 RepID=A0AAN9VRH1_9ORTH